MFDADQPIVSSAEDKLNRTVFAKYLARCMLEHDKAESLVIGLHGEWGTGKTSLINLINEEISFASSNMLEEEQAIILNFNPWDYCSQKHLSADLLIKLNSILENTPALNGSDKITSLFEDYISKIIGEPIKPISPHKRSFMQKITFRNKVPATFLENSNDLGEIKKQLNILLNTINRKIIIIFDNISRLDHHDIKEIFQMVKSTACFSNTIFLLAFNKKQVIHALNRIDSYGAEEYIEKIIQLPFEVPPISKHELSNIFESRIADVIEMVPLDAWNNEYWADMYFGSLRYFFNNCRDITRYINTLSFGYLHLRDVVNPVDFFAITAIEVFLPDVYKGIQSNKDLFSDLLDNVYEFSDLEIVEDKTRCNEIIAHNKRIPREILLNMIMVLFPRLRHIYQPGVKFYHSDAKARMFKRICSPDLFDAYFRVAMPSIDIPAAEFSTILSISSDPEEFDHALARLNQDDRILQFLDHLDTHTINKIPLDKIPSILNALMDNADLFPQGIHSPLTLDTPMRIHRIIHDLLQRHDTHEARFLLMQDAITHASKSIYICVHELQEQQLEHQENTDTFLPLEFRDLLPDQLDSLKKLTATRIQAWATSNRLQDHPSILSLLYAWRDWGDKNECMTYVNQLTESDRGLISFLTASLDKAINQVMLHYEKDPLWENYLNDINSFIAVKIIEPHAKALFEDEYFEKLREKEQLALMIFLDLIKANTRKDVRNTSE